MKTQFLNEAEVVHSIKVKEVTTGRLGRQFITFNNGVMQSVNLTCQGNMLVVNGRELLDMSQVKILPSG